MKAKRATRTQRSATAGCRGCDATWTGGGAQGAAALHHDKTSHITWARVEMVVHYGLPPGAALPPLRARRRSKAWRR